MKTQETKLGILLGVRGICLAFTRLWFQPSILKKEKKKNHKQKNKAKIEKMSKKSASNVKKQTNKNNNKTSNTSPLQFFFFFFNLKGVLDEHRDLEFPPRSPV